MHMLASAALEAMTLQLTCVFRNPLIHQMIPFAALWSAHQDARYSIQKRYTVMAYALRFRFTQQAWLHIGDVRQFFLADLLSCATVRRLPPKQSAFHQISSLIPILHPAGCVDGRMGWRLSWSTLAAHHTCWQMPCRTLNSFSCHPVPLHRR